MALSDAEHSRNYRERKLAIINAYKRTGCAVCGEEDLRCLDLHHRDPSEKNARLKGKDRIRLNGLGYWELLEELSKCDVLCANCHRKEEAPDAAA
jgi:hypothetical protein